MGGKGNKTILDVIKKSPSPPKKAKKEVFVSFFSPLNEAVSLLCSIVRVKNTALVCTYLRHIICLSTSAKQINSRRLQSSEYSRSKQFKQLDWLYVHRR